MMQFLALVDMANIDLPPVFGVILLGIFVVFIFVVSFVGWKLAGSKTVGRIIFKNSQSQAGSKVSLTRRLGFIIFTFIAVFFGYLVHTQIGEYRTQRRAERYQQAYQKCSEMYPEPRPAREYFTEEEYNTYLMSDYYMHCMELKRESGIIPSEFE